MKITTLLLIVAIVQVSAGALAQKITLKEKNAPLETVLKEIRKQSGYDFYFDQSTLQKATPVTVNLQNVTLDEALDRCFSGQPLDYKIQEQTIIIKEKEIKAPIVNKGLFAAPYLITGKVLDENNSPVVGATIKIKGTTKAVISNVKGEFSIDNNTDKFELIISFIGYKTREIAATSKSGILIILMEQSNSKLDEIQVIAYGTNTQRYNLGSVATVTAKEISDQPVNNLFQTLEGRVPGLVVTNTSGAPGAMTLTQIRGQNTLANKSPTGIGGTGTVFNNYNQPLYIIDGVPLPVQNTPLSGINNGVLANSAPSPYRYLTGLSPINGINPADIESISVLKDADATSIYGSQGSNGVILITTKRGKPGENRINVSVNSGPTTASRTTQMMNTQQYLQMRKEALLNSGIQATLAVDPDLLLFDQNKDADWKKVFFGGTGLHTDALVSASGGSATNSYLVSGGYTRETYNYPGGFSENRYSLHSSFTHKSADNRLLLDFGTDYSYDQNNTANGNSRFFAGFQLAPNFPDLIDANGKLLWSYKTFAYSSFLGNNPLAYTQQPANSELYTLNTHLAFKYQLFNSLSIGLNAGYGRVAQGYYASVPIASQNPSNFPVGSATFLNQNTGVVNIEPQLNFTKKIGLGVVSALLGGTYRQNTLDGTQTLAGNYFADALLNSIAGGTVLSATNTASYYKYAGVLARLNYIWDSKYIINLTGNRNASSNFSADEQVGNFGSAGAGWILTEESFIKQAIPFMSFAKVSVNYGTSGSDGIAPYQYQPNWNIGGFSGYQGFKGLNPANPLNPIYKWSLNQKFNESLDIAFLKDRLYMNLTFYQNKASDQLIAYLEPAQIGFNSITANAPYVVQNNGIEFSLTSKNIQSKNFQWSTSFNISHNTNKLVSFPDIAASPYASYYIVGQSVSAVTLLPYKGVDPQTGVYQFTTKVAGTVNSASAYNNVGGDATEIVDVTPKFTGGLNNSFTYKGFSLSVFFQFSVQKGLNYLYSIYNLGLTGSGRPLINEPVALLDNWKNPGDIATIQRFSAGNYTLVDQNATRAAQNFPNSTGAYTDASYIRLKNVALSYRFSPPPAIKSYIKGFTFYVNAQNLFLITGYKIGDPETQNLYTIPPQRTFVAGLNVNF